MTEQLSHIPADTEPTRIILRGLPHRDANGVETDTQEFTVYTPRKEREIRADSDTASHDMNRSPINRASLAGTSDIQFPLMFAQEGEGVFDYHLTPARLEELRVKRGELVADEVSPEADTEQVAEADEETADEDGEALADQSSAAGLSRVERRQARSRHADSDSRPLGVIDFAKQRYSEVYSNALHEATGEMKTRRERSEWRRANRRTLMLGAAAATLSAIVPARFKPLTDKLNSRAADESPTVETEQMTSETKDSTEAAHAEATGDADITEPTPTRASMRHSKETLHTRINNMALVPANYLLGRSIRRQAKLESLSAEQLDDRRRRKNIVKLALGSAAALGLVIAVNKFGYEHNWDAADPTAAVGSGFGESDLSTVPLETPKIGASEALMGLDGSTHMSPEGLGNVSDWIDGHKVAKGESVWKLSEQYLTERLGIKDPTTSQIDAVKDALLPVLKKSGATDGKGWLVAGDIIKIK